MTTKTLYFQTNYNNKLACNCFIHIDLAPRTGIPERQLNESVFEIRTTDNSHPPVQVKLFDLARMPLERITSCLSWTSHAMDTFDFIRWFLTEKPGNTLRTEMGIYFYQRI